MVIKKNPMMITIIRAMVSADSIFFQNIFCPTSKAAIQSSYIDNINVF